MRRPMDEPFGYLVFRVAAVALGVMIASPGCSRKPSGPPAPPQVADVLAGYRDDDPYGGLTIEYPLDNTLFPPDIASPTFRWKDENASCNMWLVMVRFAGNEGGVTTITVKPEWTPEAGSWAEIRRRSTGQEARVAVLGVQPLRRGDDPVGGEVCVRHLGR